MRDTVFKVVRIVIAIISFLNMILVQFNRPEIVTDNYTIYVIVSLVALIVVFIYNTYKNFDTTKAGSLGTRITRAIKSGAIASSEVLKLFDESEEDDDVGTE